MFRCSADGKDYHRYVCIVELGVLASLNAFQCDLGARTVVHPSAQILAEGGPIIIGDNNLIQEKAVIINK